jgi:hypothetical protein
MRQAMESAVDENGLPTHHVNGSVVPVRDENGEVHYVPLVIPIANQANNSSNESDSESSEDVMSVGNIEEAKSEEAENSDDDLLIMAIDDDSNMSYSIDIIDQQDDDSWGLADFDFDLDAENVEIFERPLHQFKQHIEEIRTNHLPFTLYEKACIRLMHLLRKKGATLDTYDEVMKWHLEEKGDRNPHHFISRERMFKMLHKRYNIPRNFLQQKQIRLPSTGTMVNLVYFDARQIVVNLLTDPRFGDDDWLHFDNDPLAPPPEKVRYLEDINTGLAYRETYKQLITRPGRQMLVPLVLYIDGAVTGQFDKLQVEALKMTLGILNNKARMKHYAWQSLGMLCFCLLVLSYVSKNVFYTTTLF